MNYSYEGFIFQLKKTCLEEIRRVMRQRAINVDLQPEIEEVCLDDLADLCYDKTAKGEEILCLQDNLEMYDSILFIYLLK